MAASGEHTGVCIVGSLNMDLIVRSPRLPTPGETLLGGEFATLPGGKGANQAVAAARASSPGARVRMIGAVGNDDHGRRLLAVLGVDGVDTDSVRIRPDSPTGIAVITVASIGGENTIVVAGGANQTLSADEIAQSAPAVRGSRVLLAQLESPIEAVSAAVEIARDSGPGSGPPPITILNAAPARPLPRALTGALDYLIVNRSEAAVLTGRPEAADPRTLIDALLDLGPRGVVLTLGDRGALASARAGDRDGGGAWVVPAFRVTPIDTVGAGDAFAGTFAAALASGVDRAGSLTMAAAAGALATTRRGAIPSLPTLAEIDALVAAQPHARAREE